MSLFTTRLTPRRLVSKHRWNFLASRRVCLRPDIWDLRTEAEVGRVEARTRIKAGAPVCSDGAYCVRRQIRRRIGPSRSVQGGKEWNKNRHGACDLPLCFQS